MYDCNVKAVDLRGVVVIVISIVPKVRGFKPGQGLWTFKGDINPWHGFLWRSIEAGGPISSDFTAC
jgi:hypothetical protein